MHHLLVFTVDNQRFAIDINVVDRVLMAMEVNLMPNASNGELGLINLQGKILPIFDIRKLLNYPEREMELDDQFIICFHQEKIVAIWVDAVMKVHSISKEVDMSLHELPIDARGAKYIIDEDGKPILIYSLSELLPHRKLMETQL